VFDEFIKTPILVSLERGRPIIKTAKSPILNNVLATMVKENENENKIVFSLRGNILKNKILDESKLTFNKGDEEYLQINEREYMLLNNIAANMVGTVMAIWYLIDWLDGMPVEVNYEDYVPSCKTCALNAENAKKYRYLFDARVKIYIEGNFECLLRNKAFGKKEGCGTYYIRDTYPDLGELREVIQDHL
jgi:hypothetical protein